MGVRRFRTLEDAERDLWLPPGDPRIWDGLRRRWALHRALGRARKHVRRGVERFRSLEEKQREEGGHAGAAGGLLERTRSESPFLGEEALDRIEETSAADRPETDKGSKR